MVGRAAAVVGVVLCLALAPGARAEVRGADGIPLAGREAAGVRSPSAPTAWGGERKGGEATLAERVADYRLTAALDPVKHTLEGTEDLTWRNRSQKPVQSLYFHLYLNAFENEGSTFLREARMLGGFRSEVELKKGEYGYIELARVEQGGQPLHTAFVHPDDGPDGDHSVLRVDLARPVAPGETTQLHLEFHDKLPRVIARTGYFEHFHLVAQWFPKLGVLELPGERGADEPRWNCHEFHLNSEFYADFGAFDAKVTVPRGYQVGAVGEEVEPAQLTARGEVHHFVQGDVHDFAFTAWDQFAHPLEASWHGPGSPPVHVRVLFPEEFRESAQVALKATLDSLSYFSSTLGPYPYRTSTVIVPPHNAEEAGGMEYETFFTVEGFDKTALMPLERFVTVHEFGHGYFMGLLASNEFEEPFLDEGLNQLWDDRMLERDPGPIAPPFLAPLGVGFPALRFFDTDVMGGARRSVPDPLTESAWIRMSRGSYGSVYSRTAMVFHDLESLLGTPAFERAFKLYYQRWHFRHPSTADLRESLAEGSGQRELVERWFQEQVYDSHPIDDRVTVVRSEEVEPDHGYVLKAGKREEVAGDDKPRKSKGGKDAKGAAAGDDKKEYLTTVVVLRDGAQVPQTLEIRFAGGKTERLNWPTGERWHRFELKRPLRAEAAQLDPDRKYLLDVNKLDDGRLVEPTSVAADRIALEAGTWTGFLASLVEAL